MPILTKTDVDEAALRLAYEEGEKSQLAICTEFQIGRGRLRGYIAREGWKQKKKPKPKPRKRQETAPAKISRKLNVDLEKLRAAYESAEETVELTAERFGLSVPMLYFYARGRQWSRPKRAYRKDALTAPPKPYNAEEQQALVNRLYEILGAQITTMATERAGEAEPARATRQLEQLIKCFKTMQDLKSALGGPQDHDAIRDERSVEQICTEILCRLDQRLATREARSAVEAAAGSGESGGGATP